MRVSTDDALRRVDARWLGVPGWTFPWRPTRYSAYGIGAPIAIAVIFTATRLFGSGLWTIVYGLTIAIAVTTYTMRLVDDERPASTLPALVWGELGAPRAAGSTAHSEVSSAGSDTDLHPNTGRRITAVAVSDRCPEPSVRQTVSSPASQSGSSMRLSSAGSKAHDPSDPKPTTPLRQIAGNVAMTSTMGTAWYRLAAVPWSFRPDRDRESHIINQAVVAAQLTGKKIHIRGTTTPFPVRTWAEQHHNMVVEKGRPYGAGPLECWPDLLEGEQRLFLGEHQSEKEVFVGVDFLRRSIWNQSAATLAPERVGPLTRELGRQHAKLAALDTLMARAGMNGSPVTGPQMAWLLHRSSYLGFPAPAKRLTLEVDEWGAGDLADLLGEAAWAADPFATTLRVTGILGGKAITRHVAVLTVGRMQHMDIPQADQPWMTLADSLGIPLEWSAHITPTS